MSVAQLEEYLIQEFEAQLALIDISELEPNPDYDDFYKWLNDQPALED
ncbi:MAG: hypothetical protein SFX18_02690 [Pirellulales bacterium]|nr:hypothetical protein [Pirellulales bacterium]